MQTPLSIKMRDKLNQHSTEVSQTNLKNQMSSASFIGLVSPRNRMKDYGNMLMAREAVSPRPSLLPSIEGVSPAAGVKQW
jgi:hypothetical protein